MTTVEIQIFDFSELSERAKENAHNTWLGEGHSPNWSEDNLNSLKAFYKVFPIKDTGGDWGGYTELTCEDEVAALSGHRLAKYIWNNYGNVLWKGKYYSLWSKTDQNPHYRPGGSAPMGKLKSRYSKIIKVPQNYNLTGYCMDEAVLQPIYEFLEKPDNRDFEDLLTDCVHSWKKAFKEDEESYYSIENFAELCEANEWQFTENGSFYS